MELFLLIITAVLTLCLVVGLVYQILLQRRQEQRKALDYTILANPRLPQVDEQLKERVQILFDGIPVTSVYGVVLELKNTGNTPIRAEDFEERPLDVVFGEKARVVTKEIQTNREKMDWLAADRQNGFALAPMLLNPGDALTITALVSEYGRAKVEGRLVGVSEIRDVTGIEERMLLGRGLARWILFLLYGGLISFLAVEVYVLVNLSGWTWVAPITAVLAIWFGLSAFIGFLSKRI